MVISIVESMIDNEKKSQSKNYKYEGAIVINTKVGLYNYPTTVYDVNHPYLLLDNKK